MPDTLSSRSRRRITAATALVGQSEVVLAACSLVVLAVLSYLTGRPKPIFAAALVWLPFAGLLRRHGYGVLTGLAFAIFALVMWADLWNFGALRGRALLGYSALVTAVFGCLVALDQWLPRRARLISAAATTFVAGMLVAIAAAHVWHNMTFGVSVTPDIVAALYQTNSEESIDFVREFASLKALVLLLGVVGCVGCAGVAQQRAPVRRIAPGRIGLLIGLPLVLLFVSGGDIKLFTQVVETAIQYRRELADFRELRSRRARGIGAVTATKAGASEDYVLVIGESLSRGHMHLYGYHRLTTPRLDALHERGELLKFENAYSTHTNTMPSLSLALTGASRRNGLRFFEAPSIIDVAKAAGMETYWVTNQVLYGPFDHLVSIIGHAADHLVPLNRNVGKTAETQQFDAATIDVLGGILDRPTTKSRLIVVHLIGSHTLYCRRCPREFRQFSGSLRAGDFGKARGNEKLALSVNCYDSSVLYNDYVVSGLVETLRRRGGVAGFLYFADHGEDVLGRRGHHGGRFTFPMVEIPMLTWFSEGYRETYGQRHATLTGRRDALIGTDEIFDTVLGIAGIETPAADPRSDVSGPNWGSGRQGHKLLDGRHDFLDDANARYHQRVNLTALGRRGLLSRILPHRVNSNGKLAEVLYDGAGGLELDLLFHPRGSGGFFEVGHDDRHASANDLSDVLERMQPAAPSKLWFDVKNLDRDNVDAVTATLVGLDERFDLKRRVIFESQAVELLPAIERAGFQASYYLTGKGVSTQYQNRDEAGLRREAERIAQRVRENALGAVSFDAEFYRFVKQYLEPRLPPNVRYHTWDIELNLADPSFLRRLEAADWFADDRVVTALVTYQSRMTL